MSTTSTTTTTTTPARRVPPLGGFNLTFLSLEMRRLIRNRRTVIFTLVMPVVFSSFSARTRATRPTERAPVMSRPLS